MTGIRMPNSEPQPRWIRAVADQKINVSMEDMIMTADGTDMWVSVASKAQGGEQHRFLCHGVQIPDGPGHSVMLLTAAIPAVGKWYDVDETGERIPPRTDRLTIKGDRQSRKTDLLLTIAHHDIITATLDRVRRVVVYECHNMSLAESTMRRFLEHDLAGFGHIMKSRWTNGNLHVQCIDDSRVIFQSANSAPWRGDVDVHIVDDAVQQNRYFRDRVPARVYLSECTGDIW